MVQEVPPHLDTIRYVADRLFPWRQMDLGSTDSKFRRISMIPAGAMVAWSADWVTVLRNP
jgi:hypothetical protein